MFQIKNYFAAHKNARVKDVSAIRNRFTGQAEEKSDLLTLKFCRNIAQPAQKTGEIMEEEIRKKRGCLFYGCATLAVLCVVMTGLCGFGVYTGFKLAKKFTATAPLDIPAVYVSDQDLTEIQDRLSLFANAVVKGAPTPPLELSEKDINSLIKGNNDFDQVIHITLPDNNISAVLSFPLEDMPYGEGRYFNAQITFNLTFAGGAVYADIKEAIVSGHEFPRIFLDKLENENLAKEIDDREIREALTRISSMEIKDGVLTLYPVS